MRPAGVGMTVLTHLRATCAVDTFNCRRFNQSEGSGGVQPSTVAPNPATHDGFREHEAGHADPGRSLHLLIDVSQAGQSHMTSRAVPSGQCTSPVTVGGANRASSQTPVQHDKPVTQGNGTVT